MVLFEGGPGRIKNGEMNERGGFGWSVSLKGWSSEMLKSWLFDFTKSEDMSEVPADGGNDLLDVTGPEKADC